MRAHFCDDTHVGCTYFAKFISLTSFVNCAFSGETRMGHAPTAMLLVPVPGTGLWQIRYGHPSF